MIPIKDLSYSRKTPWIRNALILLNILVFGMGLSMGGTGYTALVEQFGFMAQRFSEDPFGNFYSLISYQFFHGGFGHILGNLWYLWIFGGNVEARMGGFKFLLFYLFSGVFSCMVQVLATPYSNIPLVGASGSIAGVLGAYAAFFPRARIVTWVPFGLFGWTTQIRAFFFLVLWFLYQFLLGYAHYNPYASSGGVAWWAHVGGFVFGILFALNYKRL